MTLATALSSSMVMNTTPLAEPGLCRQVTRPEMRTRVPDGDAAQRLVLHDAAGVEIGAQELRRMRAQRQMQETVVVDDLFADRHGRQTDVGLFAASHRCVARARAPAAIELRKQRQIVITVADPAERFGRPQRLAAGEAERAESIGIGQPFQHARRKPRAQPDIAHGVVGKFSVMPEVAARRRRTGRGTVACCGVSPSRSSALASTSPLRVRRDALLRSASHPPPSAP